MTVKLLVDWSLAKSFHTFSFDANFLLLYFKSDLRWVVSLLPNMTARQRKETMPYLVSSNVSSFTITRVANV